MLIFVNCFRSLLKNPLRSLLTTMGIVIGVAAVIAIMEVGAGAATLMEVTLSDLGVRHIVIRPGSRVRNGITFGTGAAVSLTMADCEAIVRECTVIKAAVPIVRASGRMIYGNNNWMPFMMEGTTPDYLLVRNYNVGRGEMFTKSDIDSANSVCVIGSTVENQLFGSKIGIGKEIRINSVPFRVIGVFDYKGATLTGEDQDDVVAMPWTTAQLKLTGNEATFPETKESSKNLYPATSEAKIADTLFAIRFDNIQRIMATVWQNHEVEQGKAEITKLLRERHRVGEKDPNDFTLRDFSEIGHMVNTAVALIKTLLVVVALISLVVGGIGIMNIMLVSVTERTREIGLRMAIGATGRDILRQFLVESIVLCSIGGAIGILVGRGISLMLQLILGWATSVSLEAIIAGIAVSMSVGIIFGFYPAYKASRMDPIEALRYE